MGNRQKKIDKLKADIRANQVSIDELGEKLLAFGGSRATRSDILRRYTWAVREDEKLKEKRDLLSEPWWNRIGA